MSVGKGEMSVGEGRASVGEVEMVGDRNVKIFNSSTVGSTVRFWKEWLESVEGDGGNEVIVL